MSELTIPKIDDLVIDRFGNPFFTDISHGLQYRNQVTLLELLEDCDIDIPRGCIVDAGCGDGLFEALAPWIIFGNPNIGERKIIGLDMDDKKIKKAREVAERVIWKYNPPIDTGSKSRGIKIHIADSCDIAAMDTYKYTIGRDVLHFPSVGMIWCNSMLHWLRGFNTKCDALDNFYDMLSPNGIFCLSMSSTGTAEAFLRAYKLVYDSPDVGKAHKIHNPYGYLGDLPDDPIGSLKFDDIVNMVDRRGFEIVKSDNPSEGIIYERPSDYVNAVAVYGYEKFFEALPKNTPASRKRKIWSLIRKSFEEIVEREGGWHPESQGQYRQYNGYVVGVRLTPVTISKVLKDGHINSLYNELPCSSDQPMQIRLNGDYKRLSQKTTTINPSEIIKKLLAYIATDSTTPKWPTCNINYEIESEDRGDETEEIKDRSLTLKINSKTRSERPIESILGDRLSRKLERRHVITGYESIGENRTYRFQIPLILN